MDENDVAGRFKTGGALEVAAALDQAMARALTGRVLAGYRIQNLVGRGGMGLVFAAARDDERFSRKVAVKVLPVAHRSTAEWGRFFQERRILAGLNSIHIAQLHDAGETEEGWPFFVMEWVSGAPIDVYCRENALPRKAILALFAKVVRAVAYAHANLIIHRDIKPSNVFVTEQGEPKLLDFGCAKPLDTGSVETLHVRPLTPRYASPEQLSGDNVGMPSDVFQLGILLLELLVPESATSPAADPFRIGEQRDRLLSGARRTLPGDLRAILRTATELQPGDRYLTAAALADDVQRWIDGYPVDAAKIRPWHRALKLMRRNPVQSSAAAAVVIALVGSWTWYTVSLDAQRQSAELAAQRATQINDYLITLFERANPEEGGNNDLTAEQMIQRATARIGDLETQPAVQGALLTTIGTIHRTRGRYDTARQLIEQGERIRRETLGPRHPEVADSLMARGVLHWDQGEFEAALDKYQRALALLQEVHGADHPALIRPLQLIANVQYSLGHLERSRDLQRRLLKLRRRHEPPDSLEIGHTLNVLGVIGERLGQATEAESLYQRALEQYRRAMATGTTHYAGVMDNLGRLYREQGRYDESLTLHRQALSLWRELKGDRDLAVAQSLNRLALVYKESGAAEQAENMFETALEVFYDMGGEPHFTVGNVHLNLADLLVEEGRPAEALEHAHRGVEVGARGEPPRHWRHALRLLTLGRAQAHAGLHDQSLATLEQALSDLRASDVRGSIWESHALAALGESYKAAGDPHLAREAWMEAKSLLAGQEMGASLMAEVDQQLQSLP